MKRRSFLAQSAKAAFATPLIINGLPLQAFSKAAAYNDLNEETDRVLVLIQLNGGNDGLNTVLPLDQYNKLAAARSNILIPENQALTLTDATGLHPKMTGLKTLYDDAKLTVVQNVGYPNQNRSHFRSTDIWTTASHADEVLTTGWLGRYFQYDHPGYPEGYPNDNFPDPFAISMGSLVSETCQGVAANFSLAVVDPATMSPLNEGFDTSIDPASCYGQEVSFLRTALLQTNEYVTAITAAYNAGSNSATYPTDNALAQSLKTVARLMHGGLKTKVYIANLGSFDTHANQVDFTNTVEGTHATLLKTLSDAIHIFQTDLQGLGLQERVVGMTFSEFGRQIKSNFGDGTDHGTAAPLFLFGSCVNAGIVGNNAYIPDVIESQEGVAMEIDFRAIYGTVLKNWLGMSEAGVTAILGDTWQELPLLQPCTGVHTQELAVGITAQVFPNPATQYATLQWQSPATQATIMLYNSLGFALQTYRVSAVPHRLQEQTLAVRDLPAGNYYVRLQTPTAAATLPLLIVR